MRERTGDAERIERAFLLALGRPVSDEERTRSLDYLAQVRQRARSAGQAEGVAWESLARALLLSSEFVYVD